MDTRASKHVIILLDIDKTLIVYKDYTPTEKIIYTGGHHVWVNGLRKFKEQAKQLDIEIHYGLATFKKRKLNGSLLGDSIYGQITGDPRWRLFSGYSYTNDLMEFINPDLIFLLGEKLEELSKNVTPEHLAALEKSDAPADFPPVMNAGGSNYLEHEFYQCKAKNALAEARKIIETRYQTTMPQEQVYLIDDIPQICRATTLLGFSSICVHNLAQATQDIQVKVIEKIFNELLINQFTKMGSPKDSQQNLTAANVAILTILETKDELATTIEILTKDLPSGASHTFFRASTSVTPIPDEKPAQHCGSPSNQGVGLYNGTN